MRILVVDDDKDICKFLKANLERELFAVDTVHDGYEGSYIARVNEYDIIILDHVLPKKSGLEVCREIRQSGIHTPILVLSALSGVDHKSTLLDSGADDYLTKPYSHKELVSRLRALLRRPVHIAPNILRTGDICLNSETYQVTKAGKPIYLTRKEFGILELLFKNKGKIVSRNRIMEHVWDINSNIMSKAIETHLVNLRKKIETKRHRIILNIPGYGYKIDEKN